MNRSKKIILLVFLIFIIAASAAFFILNVNNTRYVVRNLENIENTSDIIDSIKYDKISEVSGDVILDNVVVSLSDARAVFNIERAAVSNVRADSTIKLSNIKLSLRDIPDVYASVEDVEIIDVDLNGLKLFLEELELNNFIYSYDWIVAQFDIKSVFAKNFYFYDRSNQIKIDNISWIGNLKKGVLSEKIIFEVRGFSVNNSLITYVAGMDDFSSDMFYERSFYNGNFSEIYNIDAYDLFNIKYSHILTEVDLDKLAKSPRGLIDSAKIKNIYMEYNEYGAVNLFFKIMKRFVGNREDFIHNYIAKDDSYLPQLANRQDVIEEISEFIMEPDKLIVSMEPVLPVSYSDLDSVSEDTFNLLNITVSVNDRPNVHLIKSSSSNINGMENTVSFPEKLENTNVAGE